MKTPEERIARAEELDALIAPGPYKKCGEDGEYWIENQIGQRIEEFTDRDRAVFFAESRALLPALAADAKRARVKLQESEANRIGTVKGLIIDRNAAQRLADEAREELSEVKDQLAAARKKNAELNRRCQLAESAANQNIEECRRQGVGLGRGLAQYGYRQALDDRDQAIERAEKAEQERDRLKAEVEALKTERTQVLRAQQIGLQDKARQMALPPEGLAVLLGIDSKTAWSDGCPRMAFRSYMITLGAYAAYIEFGGTPIEADLEQPLPAAPTEGS